MAARVDLTATGMTRAIAVSDHHSRSPRRRPASSSDVARLAGVSVQTVSRVLNDHPMVSARTRAKVDAAITELDYRPNRSARALVTGETGLIGVLVTGRTHTGPSAILQSLDETAGALGYALILRSLPDDRRDLVHEAIEQLLRVGIDGIIVVASALPEALTAGPAWPVPVVVVQGCAAPGLRSIGLDDGIGAGQAVRHLLQQGHSRVWHVAGPDGWWESRHRRSGWNGALQDAGITPPPALVGDWTARSGYRAGTELARDPEVTAVFVANDEMAAGVVAAFKDAGRAVPGDVSVVGFDDSPLTEFLDPPLTTVRPEHAQLGRRAVQLLLSERRGPAVPDETPVVGASLVVRESTRAPGRMTSRCGDAVPPAAGLRAS